MCLPQVPGPAPASAFFHSFNQWSSHCPSVCPSPCPAGCSLSDRPFRLSRCMCCWAGSPCRRQRYKARGMQAGGSAMGNENDSRKTADAVARDCATPPCVRLLTSASCAWKGAALPARHDCLLMLLPQRGSLPSHRPDVARTGEPGGRRRRPRILYGRGVSAVACGGHTPARTSGRARRITPHQPVSRPAVANQLLGLHVDHGLSLRASRDDGTMGASWSSGIGPGHQTRRSGQWLNAADTASHQTMHAPCSWGADRPPH